MNRVSIYILKWFQVIYYFVGGTPILFQDRYRQAELIRLSLNSRVVQMSLAARCTILEK